MGKKIIITTITIMLILPLLFTGEGIASDGYTNIYTPEDLAAIANNPTGNYRLMSDLDMSDTKWTPIEFHGTFDGGGFTLYNLHLGTFSEQTYETVDGNYKVYDTYFASLFSHCENAVIKKLNLVNVHADIETDKHCFIAGIVGSSVDTELIECNVEGRMTLTSTNIMVGLGGLVGFGSGYAVGCRADMTMVIIDNNPKHNTEEFIGGIWSVGYPDIENCTGIIDAYATTLSYTHNGAIIGMHHMHPRGNIHYGYVKYCTANMDLHIFDHRKHPHRHNGPIAGEKLNRYVGISLNTVIKYNEHMYTDFNTIIKPCMCENPEYIEKVTDYTCTEWGYTTYTCQDCGYSYRADYTPPRHTAGEFELVQEPTYDMVGLLELRCTECNKLLDSEEIAKLVPVAEIYLTEDNITINYKSTAQVDAVVSPIDAENKGLEWSSTDESVVTINSDGVMEAVGRGEAMIICRAADGQGAMVTLGVEVEYTFKQWLIIIFLFGWAWY